MKFLVYVAIALFVISTTLPVIGSVVEVETLPGLVGSMLRLCLFVANHFSSSLPATRIRPPVFDPQDAAYRGYYSRAI